MPVGWDKTSDIPPCVSDVQMTAWMADVGVPIYLFYNGNGVYESHIMLSSPVSGNIHTNSPDAAKALALRWAGRQFRILADAAELASCNSELHNSLRH